MISIFERIQEIFSNEKFVELNMKAQEQEHKRNFNEGMSTKEFRQFKREIINQQKQRYGIIYTEPVIGKTYRDCCNCIYQEGVGPEGSFIQCKTNWGILRMRISKELREQFKYKGMGITFPCTRFVKQSWIKKPYYTYPE